MTPMLLNGEGGGVPCEKWAGLFPVYMTSWLADARISRIKSESNTHLRHRDGINYDVLKETVNEKIRRITAYEPLTATNGQFGFLFQV